MRENTGQSPDLSVFWGRSHYVDHAGNLANVGPFFNLIAFQSYFGAEAGARLEKYFELVEHYGGNVPETEQAVIEGLKTAFQAHAGFSIDDVLAARDRDNV